MTTTERAAEIRKALKAKGWSTRKVSVRADYFSGGSSIDVTIKDPAVPLPTVKAIATAHESIRYCEYSGEILSGGNRYVSVRYSREALETLRAKYLEPVKAAVAKIEGGYLIPVEGTPFLVGLDAHGHHLSLWGESHLGNFYSEADLAEAVGVRMVATAN